jgi:hypothetical protein
MRSTLRIPAIGVMAALVAAAAGCGSGSGSHSGGSGRPAPAGSAQPGQAVQAAYLTSSGQKTAAFRLDETVQASSSTRSSPAETVTGSGQADFATRSFKMVLSLPAGGSVTVLRTSQTEYVQVPAADRSQIPGRKPWVSVDLNQVSQAKLGASLSQLSSVSSGNPAQALSELAAVSGRVTRTGAATIGGVPTTAYQAQVDLNKVAADVQAKAGPKAAQAIREEARALGTSILPVQLWVDPSHLVRQIRYHVAIPASAGTPGAAATATITFSGYGTPVSLNPPPASQTADVTSQVIQQSDTGSG